MTARPLHYIIRRLLFTCMLKAMLIGACLFVLSAKWC